MIDIHTHILPKMDDGSDSVETSTKMLKELKDQGVKLVYLTSHFYPRNEEIDDFLKRRNEAYHLLNNLNLDIELKLGAEVHYYRGISASENIGKLCLEDTNLLLLELPFSYPINDFVLKDLINLNYRYRVILAHIERYDLNDKIIRYLKDNDILLQSNCEYLIDKKTCKKALKYYKHNLIDFMGSDCHNLEDRAPNYKQASDILKNKINEEFYFNLVDKTHIILDV